MSELESIKERIAEKLGVKKEELEEPSQKGFGDFAYPCFQRAKAEGKKPIELAKELAEGLKIEGIKEIKAIGPYVNFYIDWAKLGSKILKEINEDYGKAKEGKRAVVDFSSPNPAHPFHMGTTRSTLVGEALCRILESQGWEVKRFCYINDLGKQAATLLVGYQILASGKSPEGKPDVWLGKLYFDINARAAKEPALEAKIEETIKGLEERKKDLVSLAKRIFKWCLEGFKINWERLGIKFSDIKWESEFIEDSKEVVERAKENDLVFESEGALVLNLEPHGLPNTVFVRKDGTGLYLTRDIACTLWKFEKYKPDLNIWVVAEDQSLHFNQLKKTLELLGYPEMDKRSKHLAFSMVLLEGKKMSSRKGWFVLWDNVLADGMRKAYEEVSKRWPELPEEEKQSRAESIALGAIVYFINRYAPEKSVNFSWDKALSFEGDTGPYLQYSHARAGSILTKGGRAKDFNQAAFRDEREFALLKILAKYPAVLKRSARDLRPHYLANYLHELANAFNEFYQSVPVLKAETEEQKRARLKLVEAVKIVLKSGLYLLGIEAPEQM